MQSERNELIRLQTLGILKRLLEDKYIPENLETCPSEMIEKLWQTVAQVRVERTMKEIIDSYVSMVAHKGLIEYRHVEPLKKDLSSQYFRDELIFLMSPYMLFSPKNILSLLALTTARYSTQFYNLQNEQQVREILEQQMWRVATTSCSLPRGQICSFEEKKHKGNNGTTVGRV